MIRSKLTLLIAFLTIVFTSCDEKNGDTTPSVSFTQVNPILVANCQPCHVAGSGANFDARAKFVNDFNIAKNVASGIISRINKDPGAAGFMPATGTKLSAGNIQTIQDWIDDGLNEN